MAIEEHKKKAFDFAADLTKQLITLSTAIITLTVTFSKEIIGGVDSTNRFFLLAAWISFIISILLGFLTLMALTGNLDPMPKKEKKPDGTTAEIQPDPILTINSSNVTGTGKWQVWTFFLGIILSCVYGYLAATNQDDKIINHKNDYMIIRKSQLNSDSTVYTDTLYLPINRSNEK